MSRQAGWTRVVASIRTGPVLALAMAAAVALGLIVGTNLVVTSQPAGAPVRLSTTASGARPTPISVPGSSSNSGLKGGSGDGSAQSSEPVETVTAPGTVVRIPDGSSSGGDKPQATPTPSCSAEGSGGDAGSGACSSGG
ncbi:MAG TPA: hypothetical protein VNF24_03765 [Candidatus Acidoferrales bacterium]|nr:hypothetical protein [Candidatus Acidoferrales bacterium]